MTFIRFLTFKTVFTLSKHSISHSRFQPLSGIQTFLEDSLYSSQTDTMVLTVLGFNSLMFIRDWHKKANWNIPQSSVQSLFCLCLRSERLSNPDSEATWPNHGHLFSIRGEAVLQKTQPSACPPACPAPPHRRGHKLSDSPRCAFALWLNSSEQLRQDRGRPGPTTGATGRAVSLTTDVTNSTCFREMRGVVGQWMHMGVTSGKKKKAALSSCNGLHAYYQVCVGFKWLSCLKALAACDYASPAFYFGELTDTT